MKIRQKACFINFIWKLAKACFINFIWNDHLCKILYFFTRNKLLQCLKGMRLTFELELVDISTTVASASCTGLILAVSKVYKLTTLKPGVHATGKHTFVLFSLPHHTEIWLIKWFLKCEWVSVWASKAEVSECVCVSKRASEGVINQATCRVREGAINQSSEQESECLKSY